VVAALTPVPSMVNFGTGADKRWRGAVGASCAVRSGKKWHKEEKVMTVSARPLFKRAQRREQLGRGVRLGDAAWRQERREKGAPAPTDERRAAGIGPEPAVGMLGRGA
jgi:hypothetical protein